MSKFIQSRVLRCALMVFGMSIGCVTGGNADCEIADIPPALQELHYELLRQERELEEKIEWIDGIVDLKKTGLTTEQKELAKEAWREEAWIARVRWKGKVMTYLAVKSNLTGTVWDVFNRKNMAIAAASIGVIAVFYYIYRCWIDKKNQQEDEKKLEEPVVIEDSFALDTIVKCRTA